MPSLILKAGSIVNEYLEHIGDSLLVEDGRVKSVNPIAGYATEKHYHGLIAPAIVDAHLHITWIGLALQGADLQDSRTPEDVAKKLAKTQGPIAYGRGWDQENFTVRGTMPTRKLLDQYIPDRPAVAVRVCGHLAVANTLALHASQIHSRYPELVDVEAGIVREDAVYHLVEALLEKVDTGVLVGKALEYIKSHGVLGVSSMSCPVSEATALAGIQEAWRLRLRVSCYPRPDDLDRSLRILGREGKAAVVGIKDFADGSLGARTAYLSIDYNDDPGNKGMRLLDAKTIVRKAGPVLRKGFRIAIHAIGDAALDEVIEAYEALSPGPNGRIEHASIVRPGQEKRLAGIGVHVVVQPHFRVSDWWIMDRLGSRRLTWAYPFRRLADSGVRLAFSTDSPVEPIDPAETFKAALSRCSQPSCLPSEALTPEEAFLAYTRNAAEASGGPVAELGQVKPGSPACFTILAGDPRREGLRISGVIDVGC
ncbi:MAG: amidohydrolase [Desulfurococcales archaeon]|nr:amidohydrolase [Desulfurococcales archaeon]